MWKRHSMRHCNHYWHSSWLPRFRALNRSRSVFLACFLLNTGLFFSYGGPNTPSGRVCLLAIDLGPRCDDWNRTRSTHGPGLYTIQGVLPRATMEPFGFDFKHWCLACCEVCYSVPPPSSSASYAALPSSSALSKPLSPAACLTLAVALRSSPFNSPSRPRTHQGEARRRVGLTHTHDQ